MNKKPQPPERFEDEEDFREEPDFSWRVALPALVATCLLQVLILLDPLQWLLPPLE